MAYYKKNLIICFIILGCKTNEFQERKKSKYTPQKTDPVITLSLEVLDSLGSLCELFYRKDKSNCSKIQYKIPLLIEKLDSPSKKDTAITKLFKNCAVVGFPSEITFDALEIYLNPVTNSQSVGLKIGNPNDIPNKVTEVSGEEKVYKVADPSKIYMKLNVFTDQKEVERLKKLFSSSAAELKTKKVRCVVD